MVRFVVAIHQYDLTRERDLLIDFIQFMLTLMLQITLKRTGWTFLSPGSLYLIRENINLENIIILISSFGLQFLLTILFSFVFIIWSGLIVLDILNVIEYSHP